MRKMGRKERIEVALVQLRAKASFDRAAALIERARGADLVILPELWRVGYLDFSAWEDESEPLHGETVAFLAAEARRIGAYVLGGSFIEAAGGRRYNTAPFLDPAGNLLGVYRKRNLLSYRSQEQALLTPGDAPLVVRTEIGTFGAAICYDLRFPELFRAMARQGVEVFLVPAAWPIIRLEAWEVLTRARATEDQAYLLGCNAVGKGLLGRSIAADPHGTAIARGGGEEGVVRAELDLAGLREFREEFPAWREG